MTLRLRRPTDAEYQAWFAAALRSYADDIVASGTLGREAAEAKSRLDHAELLPDGLATPGQFVFRLCDDEQPVGWLWLALQAPRGDAGTGWIYDIEVEAAFRGRGYGRGAMLLAEEEARRLGLVGLALNVFGHNTVARSLYTTLGYQITAIQMKKRL
jgi:ribosomal protein S18 acetylase RimI-like enzyme